MKLLAVPAIPPALLDDFVGASKFISICETMLVAGTLNDGNVHMVEVAAQSYSRWQAADALMESEGIEANVGTHVHRHRDAFMRALNYLGLVKTKAVKVESAKKKPAPIKIAPAIQGHSQPPLRIRIYGSDSA